jgi:hypothetical protein
MATPKNTGKKEVWSGDTIVMDVTVRKDDDTRKDLTGANIRWTLADDQYSVPELSKTEADADVIIASDPTTGEFEITIQPSETDNLGGAYYHECEVVDGAGVKSTVFYGKLDIREDAI